MIDVSRAFLPHLEQAVGEYLGGCQIPNIKRTLLTITELMLTANDPRNLLGRDSLLFEQVLSGIRTKGVTGNGKCLYYDFRNRPKDNNDSLPMCVNGILRICIQNHGIKDPLLLYPYFEMSPVEYFQNDVFLLLNTQKPFQNISRVISGYEYLLSKGTKEDFRFDWLANRLAPFALEVLAKHLLVKRTFDYRMLTGVLSQELFNTLDPKYLELIDYDVDQRFLYKVWNHYNLMRKMRIS